ncbi:peptidase C65 Otubain-domain-containing protein [Xylariomycetidae sp. FL0641]|nr:peptidase C65 Otubain-domain-containing protein [Xylariomycetidae sp. FL0641]
MVGHKVDSNVIPEEYKDADPTYVTKTKVSVRSQACHGFFSSRHIRRLMTNPLQALARTYSHFRPVLGDGNCGWRAVAFAYFESLIYYCHGSGSTQKLQSERARLKSYLGSNLDRLFEQMERELLEDMEIETYNLFDEIIAELSKGQDPDEFVIPEILMAKYFNDAQVSPSLLYTMRLAAVCWLVNSPEFHPFLDGGLDSHIERIKGPSNEMESIDNTALSNILLGPAGMALKVVYLDRTDGDEANVHNLSPEEAHAGVIYLLYRPSHYDILYPREPTPVPSVPTQPVSLQVNRVTSFDHHNLDVQSSIASLQDYSTVDMSALALIPGFDPPAMQPFASPTATGSPLTDTYVPSPQSMWFPQQFPETMPAPPAQQPTPPQQQHQPPPPTNPITVHQLRFSKYNFPNLPEMAESNTYEPAFTTNTFKNSHFNVAHYNNMNFQPEMYKPEAEDEPLPSARAGGRKRSSEHCGMIKKEK